MKKTYNFINGIRKNVFNYIDDLLLVIGIALLSIGVFKIYIPAGYITLGACFIAFAFLYAHREVGDRG